MTAAALATCGYVRTRTVTTDDLRGRDVGALDSGETGFIAHCRCGYQTRIRYSAIAAQSALCAHVLDLPESACGPLLRAEMLNGTATTAEPSLRGAHVDDRAPQPLAGGGSGAVPFNETGNTTLRVVTFFAAIGMAALATCAALMLLASADPVTAMGPAALAVIMTTMAVLALVDDRDDISPQGDEWPASEGSAPLKWGNAPELAGHSLTPFEREIDRHARARIPFGETR